MVKLVIFDLDGTLLDTLTDVGLCFNRALSACGLPQHPLSAFGSFVGGNLEQVVARMLPADMRDEETVDKVKTAYRGIYAADSKPHTKPFSGVHKMLDSLSGEGVNLAVNTNKAQDLAATAVREHFGCFFMPVAGYRLDVPSKPHPDGPFELMRFSNVEPKETLYVGDGETDLRTALNAGIEFVFASWGATDRGGDVARSATYVAAFPEEIVEMVKRMNRE